MKRLIALLAIVPAIACAEPIFGDEFMEKCIKSAMDQVFSQSGPVSAGAQQDIVKMCLCARGTLNRTVAPADIEAAMAGNGESFSRKIEDARRRCAPRTAPTPNRALKSG